MQNTWAQAYKKLLTDQRLSQSGSGRAREEFSHSIKESHWKNHGKQWERQLARRGQA